MRAKKKIPWEKLASCSKGISPEMPSYRLLEVGEVRVSSSNSHPFQVLGQSCFLSCQQKFTLLFPTHLWFTVGCDTWRVIYS